MGAIAARPHSPAAQHPPPTQWVPGSIAAMSPSRCRAPFWFAPAVAHTLSVTGDNRSHCSQVLVVASPNRPPYKLRVRTRGDRSSGKPPRPLLSRKGKYQESSTRPSSRHTSGFWTRPCRFQSPSSHRATGSTITGAFGFCTPKESVNQSLENWVVEDSSPFEW